MTDLHRLRGRITALVLSEAWRRRAALWGGAVAVAIALATPAERLLAHAYAMGFDPAARQFS